MGRPRVPRISRRKALEIALAIIDNEGLDALSMRRLGEELQVNKASLYHHFKNKEAILVGATELALAHITAPRSDSDSWRVWMPLNAYLLRKALIAHPELISIMLRRISLGIGRAEVELAVGRLKSEGVPDGAIAPLMESLEMVAIVSAMQAISRPAVTADGEGEPKYELYQQARQDRSLSDDEMFDVILPSVLSSVESAVVLKEVTKASKRARKAGAVPRPSKRTAP
ncbi:MAG: TetR/AcrR family transcriptional regulator, tetracycline repressor protein [Pseudonocardiales bacterium]|jgi:AcrR family transcriptional regulator|nr:TetR/AcrR family transcriptional regulator, tetracycline repressor protein [Pseudonocardiales bacterium]